MKQSGWVLNSCSHSILLSKVAAYPDTLKHRPNIGNMLFKAEKILCVLYSLFKYNSTTLLKKGLDGMLTSILECQGWKTWCHFQFQFLLNVHMEQGAIDAGWNGYVLAIHTGILKWVRDFRLDSPIPYYFRNWMNEAVYWISHSLLFR